MLKQTLITGIMGLGMVLGTASMASPYYGSHHGDYNYIQPIQPTNQYCVSGQRIDRRQASQKRRIDSGVRKGLLVEWEKRELRQEQRRIKKAERRMRSDGCLTRSERNRLMKRLDRASDRIRQLKQNHIHHNNVRYRPHRPHRPHHR